MTDNLNEIAIQAMSKVELNENDIVLDIGCNDGTSYFVPTRQI